MAGTGKFRPRGVSPYLAALIAGMCRSSPGASLDTGHQAASALMRSDASRAVMVAGLHTLSMFLAGGLAVVGTYYWSGLRARARDRLLQALSLSAF